MQMSTRRSVRACRDVRAGVVDLRSVGLFVDVPDIRLQEIAEAAWQERFSPHALVIEQDDNADTFYAVEDGTVEVFSQFEEQETVLDVVECGASLLLGSVMSGCPYGAAARALSPVRILAIPGASIHQLFDADNSFARAVACELARDWCNKVSELHSLKTRTSLQRLADWLARAAKPNVNGNGEFRLPFGKRTLASRLGMTPACLSRTLRRLTKYGVRVRGREVTVVDWLALSASVEGHR